MAKIRERQGLGFAWGGIVYRNDNELGRHGVGYGLPASLRDGF